MGLPNPYYRVGSRHKSMRLSLPPAAQQLISEQDVPLEILTLTAPYDVPKGELIVTAIAQRANGDTLFVKNNKPNRSWEFPSGHVESDEHPDAAVKREFEEETGYEATQATPMLVLVWAFPDDLLTQIIYSVDCGEQVGTPVPEIDDVEWRADLPDMVSFGNIGRDAFQDMLQDASIQSEGPLDDIKEMLLDTMGSKRSIAAGAVTGGALIIGLAQRYRANADDDGDR